MYTFYNDETPIQFEKITDGLTYNEVRDVEILFDTKQVDTILHYLH